MTTLADRILEILTPNGMTYLQIAAAIKKSISPSAMGVAILSLEKAGKVTREKIIYERPTGVRSDDYQRMPKVLVRRKV